MAEEIIHRCDNCNCIIEGKCFSALHIGSIKFSISGWGRVEYLKQKETLDELCEDCFIEYIKVLKPLLNFCNLNKKDNSEYIYKGCEKNMGIFRNTLGIMKRKKIMNEVLGKK